MKLLYVLMSFTISIRLKSLLALDASSHVSMMWNDAVSNTVLILRSNGILAVIDKFLWPICFFFYVVIWIILL